MQHRLASGIDGVHHVGDRRQQLVFDLNEGDSILRDVPRIGDHQRHRFANVTDFAERDAALFDRRIGKTGQQPGLLCRVFAGNHRDDAADRQRRAGIDRLDARMGVRAPQHRDMRHVR